MYDASTIRKSFKSVDLPAPFVPIIVIKSPDLISKLIPFKIQALSFLMATIEKPDILLLDEHTAALDPHTSENLLAVVSSA